jgi:hypothetical protein
MLCSQMISALLAQGIMPHFAAGVPVASATAWRRL